MMLKYFQYFDNIITLKEEKVIIDHLNSILNKRKYEGNHWDDVIMHYKEIELNERNCPFEVISILNKVKDFVIDKGNLQDKPVLPIHAIDLRADGKIAAHIDSIKASGGTVAGLSLLSTRILRLEHDPTVTIPSNVHRTFSSSSNTSLDTLNSENATKLDPVYEFYLPPRSLYILQGDLRYTYTHAILGKDCKSTLIRPIPPEDIQRRLSLMFRDSL